MNKEKNDKQAKLPFKSGNVETPKMEGGNEPAQVQDSATSADYGMATGCLGLATDHRRLLDASQDGWLRPPNRSGFLLGRQSFVSEPDRPQGRNSIPVRLAFDRSKLSLFEDTEPDFKQGVSRLDAPDELVATVQWPAPIPLYAVAKIEVCSSEQKARILAMADQFHNVSLPDIEVTVGDSAVCDGPTGFLDDGAAPPVELPASLDAVQGAMAMAVWAVPRIGPWVEILRGALNGDRACGTKKLDTHWLRFPWFDHGTEAAGDEQQALWRAALSCMQSPTAAGKSPRQLAENIARAACQEGSDQNIKSWLDRTLRIVTADETVDCGNWRQDGGAGLAIRLVLLRPEPMRFKSWHKNLPSLPPSAWWAAAILCGWRHGYRALGREFRGKAPRQEYLTIRALAASLQDNPRFRPFDQTPLEERIDDECFSLTWHGRTVLRKPWHARAKWYRANLTNDVLHKAAQDLASKLGWSCFKRHLWLPEGRIPVDTRSLSIENHDLVVSGETVLELPPGNKIKKRFDPEVFQQQLATEAGEVPEPPNVPRQGPLPEIPGLTYRPNFITEEQEADVLDHIDHEGVWSNELERRVQHYGWRYDYKQRQLDESMRCDDLPEWAIRLAQQLVNEGLIDEISLPDQVIVNEYRGKQGISKHIDHVESFAEPIATISLLESWGMVFRHGRDKVEKILERRSVTVLTGPARYKWTHEIPKRKNEWPPQGKRVPRDRRISLTFRKAVLGQTRAVAPNPNI